MAKTKQLSESARIEIIRLHSVGLTQREIAKQVGCGNGTVSYTLSRYNEHKTVKDLQRSGRKKISTERDQRSLLNLVKKNRKSSSQQLALQWFLSNGKTASPRTVRRVLQEHNYLWRPACKKPRLNSNHIQQRLEFCKTYKSWTNNNWRDVLFSDEMNIEVDSRKCRVMLRRTPNEKYHPDCIQQRTKQGSGSIGIWACMSYDGVGFYHIVQRKTQCGIIY